MHPSEPSGSSPRFRRQTAEPNATSQTPFAATISMRRAKGHCGARAPAGFVVRRLGWFCGAWVSAGLVLRGSRPALWCASTSQHCGIRTRTDRHQRSCRQIRICGKSTWPMINRLAGRSCVVFRLTTRWLFPRPPRCGRKSRRSSRRRHAADHDAPCVFPVGGGEHPSSTLSPSGKPSCRSAEWHAADRSGRPMNRSAGGSCVVFRPTTRWISPRPARCRPKNRRSSRRRHAVDRDAPCVFPVGGGEGPSLTLSLGGKPSCRSGEWRAAGCSGRPMNRSAGGSCVVFRLTT